MSTDADAVLFVDQGPVLGKLERALRLQLNALFLGERGSGKTSVLHQLERRQRSEGRSVRFVEASTAATVEDLVDLLYAAVRGRPRDPMEKVVGTLVRDTGVAADLRRLADAANGEPLVLLVDGILSPNLVHELFGRQRDELWQLPFRWVVAGHESERNRYLEPPADSFFDAVVELEELSVEDATALLLQRAAAPGAGDDPAAEVLRGVSAVLAQRVTPRTPRQLLSAARTTLLADDDPTVTVQNLSALQQRAADLGRPAAMLFAELMNMGPVSASDERLLERLGWTRARIVQVLKQLESEGLVVATTETKGQGRPRKLYQVNPHHHAARRVRPS